MQWLVAAASAALLLPGDQAHGDSAALLISEGEDDEGCMLLLQRGAAATWAPRPSPPGVLGVDRGGRVRAIVDTSGFTSTAAVAFADAAGAGESTSEGAAAALSSESPATDAANAGAFGASTSAMWRRPAPQRNLSTALIATAATAADPPLSNVWKRIASSVSESPHNTSAAKVLEVTVNHEGDLHNFLSSLAFDSLTTAGLIVVFCYLRSRFKLVYSGNVEQAGREELASEAAVGKRKQEADFPHRSKRWQPLAWIPNSLGNSVDAIQDNVGLDSAMLVEFSHLAMKICVAIGMPMCLLMCPANYWLGRMPQMEVDPLSRIGIANITPGSWLCWAQAGGVWFMVVMAQLLLHQAMSSFLPRRWRWLKTMPPPRSTTLLVENVPKAYRSDARLRAFFGNMFSPEQLEAVHVVKRTDNLLGLIATWRSTEVLLKEAQAAAQQGAGMPTHYVMKQGWVNSVDFYHESMRQLHAQITQEQQRIWDAASIDTPDLRVYTASAFVTFRQRHEAEIALRLQYKPDSEEFVMSTPPDPEDVRWGDLKADPTKEALLQGVGYLCIIALYIGFLPITVGISSVTNLKDLRDHLPLVERFLVAFPFLDTVLEGVLASLALTIFLSLLPTVMMMIFDNFFVLKADAWSQHKLQVWYFWFQVVFILLVTAVGSSVVVAFNKIVERPFEIFGLLADSLPSATHFYMDFMVLQWATHALNLTRYINLLKYMALRPILGKRKAKKLCEPENQDYYGFGSRAARWTNLLVIALVFSSLVPPICILGLVNFALCRLIYGYLIVYAETKKPDLGGVFFVQQLHHVQKGLFIYIALMIGVLSRKASGHGPALVAIAALAFQARSYYKFRVWFTWEQLPFEELIKDSEQPKRGAAATSYAQPELLEQFELPADHSGSDSDSGCGGGATPPEERAP